MGVIEKCCDLTKIYGEAENAVIACNHIDLEICRGEFIAITGDSGSGKSTLLNILGGLDYATSGSILLDGIELVGMTDKELTSLRREKIGFIFQDYNLIPILSVYENIVLSVQIARKKIDNIYIKNLIEMLGISELDNRMPNQLSGGQQQRVAIARALASKPSIILADEPTGNLDSRSGNEVIELFKKAVVNLGQTVVMVTHNVQHAQYCDKKYVLKDGVLLPDDE